jgi:hypothetical protein
MENGFKFSTSKSFGMQLYNKKKIHPDPASPKNSKSVYRRTDNTMANRTSKKGQTTIYKTYL